MFLTSFPAFLWKKHSLKWFFVSLQGGLDSNSQSTSKNQNDWKSESVTNRPCLNNSRWREMSHQCSNIELSSPSSKSSKSSTSSLLSWDSMDMNGMSRWPSSASMSSKLSTSSWTSRDSNSSKSTVSLMSTSTSSSSQSNSSRSSFSRPCSEDETRHEFYKLHSVYIDGLTSSAGKSPGNISSTSLQFYGPNK